MLAGIRIVRIGVDDIVHVDDIGVVCVHVVGDIEDTIDEVQAREAVGRPRVVSISSPAVLAADALFAEIVLATIPCTSLETRSAHTPPPR